MSIARILSKPLSHRKSFFLLGPRATGKTSWIKQHLPTATYIDLLNLETFSYLQGDPHRLVEFVPPSTDNWIVIDEIQKIPALLDEVHRLIESQHVVFVLTGSSARSLRKKGVNLLAGRALIYHMHPLIPEELGDQFDLSFVLQFGLLPALQQEADPSAYLKAYVGTYLREEVMQEGLTRNLSAFSRFLETAGFSQGAVLNMSSIARDAGVIQKSVSNYFDILEDLLIGVRIPIFTKRAKRQTIQHPKFYFFDAGVYQALRPKGIMDAVSEIEGVALETLFLQSVRAVNDYWGLDYQLYYWRTQSGVEVDFILYGPRGFFAFEIKKSKNVSSHDAKALRAFSEDYPEAALYLLYAGEQTLYFDRVTVLPIKTALMSLSTLLSK